MLTINSSNIFSLIGNLTRITANLNASAQRLSTGQRINSGADDPAGIISLAQLNDEITQIEAASTNAQRVSSIINTADGGLSQISSLLLDIESLALEAANSGSMTQAEIAANQSQIDEAIASIDRIVGTTTFNGQRLLDGTLGYNTTGVDNSKITDVNVFSKSTGENVSISVEVTTAAERGMLVYEQPGLSGNNAVQLEIGGNKGTVVLDLAASSSNAQIASAVNAHTAETGVEASVSGGDLYFISSSYGQDQFVSVEALSGTFELSGSETIDYGENAAVTVNGTSVTADGLRVSYNGNNISMEFMLTESFGTSVGSSESFQVTGGGAQFQIAPGAAGTVYVGIGSFQSQHLGNSVTGYLRSLLSGGENDLTTNPQQAALIAREAINEVARARGRLGGLETYTVQATTNALQTAQTNLLSARSQILDVDYADEIANFTRQQILQQAGVELLGAFAMNGQSILSLLGSAM